jgi:hypothetical protein
MRQAKDAYNKGKTKTIGTVTDESLIIVFRDDEYAIDCKSHFPEIVDACEFNADCFIEAVYEAIRKELEKQAGKQITDEQVEKIKQQQEEEQFRNVDLIIQQDVEQEQKANEEENREKYLQSIMNKYKSLSNEQKKAIKQVLTNNNVVKIPDLSTDELANIVNNLL